jgi:hypothetical protein
MDPGIVGRAAELIAGYVAEFQLPRWIRVEDFDGADPMFGDADVLYTQKGPGFFMNTKPTDVPSFDVRLLVDSGSDRKAVGGKPYTFMRIRSVTTREARGKVIGFWPHLVSIQRVYTHVPPGGYVGPSFFGYRGGRWHECTNLPITKPPPALADWYSRMAQLGRGIAFTRDYDWIVKIGSVGSVRLSLITDPEGAREVFRLRDIPNGASRRSALRHWVEHHWRRTRSGSTPVREHLRGTQRFAWNGWDCEIVPSPHDVRQASPPGVSHRGKCPARNPHERSSRGSPLTSTASPTT